MATPPPDLATALGDRYVLDRVLGRGGMATVYLARDTRHRRPVAIKVLDPELAAVLGSERFLREIETTASLRHPHILPLFDSGEAGLRGSREAGKRGSGEAPFLYYVMPFVEGDTLRDRLQRERQRPLDESLRIAREVADALAYAHRHGIVHRDIKPGNILLESGHAVVADFGIARAIRAAGGERLTQTGLGVGTPEYMSPEQVAGGHDIDGRSDIYSLGCVLYEMLAGHPPFSGPTAASIVQQHMVAEARSVNQLRPSVSPDVAAVITRAIAKNPADRWQDAAELRDQLGALEHVPGKGPAPTTPVTPVAPPRRRWIGVAAGVAALGLLGFAGSRLLQRDAPAIEFGRRTQITHGPGLEVHPALSPDGQLLAHIAGEGSRLFVRQVEGGGRPIPVAPDLPGVQGWPHWSQDGTQLSFISIRGIETVPALGGAPRLLVPIERSQGLVVVGGPWSPDQRELSFVRGDTLYAVAIAGGTTRVVTTEPRLHSCAWSPNGRWIACVSGNFESMTLGPWFGNIGPSTVLLIPASGGQAIRLIADGQANTSPAWLPDGTLLFISNREGGRDIYAVRIGRDGHTTAPPRRLTTGLNAVSITTSADGRRIGYAAFTETSNIWSTPAPPGEPVRMNAARQVTTGSQVIEFMGFSPDSRWLVYDSDRSGVANIYRMPMDRAGEPERLAPDSINQFWPAWSPDGSEIAFHSFRAGHRQLYLVPSGGGRGRPVMETDLDDRTASWSPDGKALLFLTDYGSPSAATRIIRKKADGTWGAPEIWRQPPCMPTWSPDGGLVACAELGGRILLTTADGDSLHTLVTSGLVPDMGQYPQWSSDGRTVYYMSQDSLGGYSVHAVPVTGGPSRVALRFDDPTRPWHRYGFRVFGDRFWFTIGERESHVWVGEVEE
jgi:serine/threonine-protein kinase